MTPNDILLWCQNYLADLLGVAADRMDPDSEIADLGLDSAAAVAMVMDLETRLGQELDPDILFEYGTLRKLAEGISARRVAALVEPSAS